MDIRFEPLGSAHQSAVMRIFNSYVDSGTAAFPAEPLPEAFFGIFLEKSKGYPAYAVIRSENGEVVGFCMLSAYNPLSTFRETAALSCFLSWDCTGQGIGAQCLARLEADAAGMGISHLIAEISSENKQSQFFHEKHGFRQRGVLKEIGRKLDRNFDVVYLQKDLNRQEI